MASAPRLLLYSHDSVGLGHLRRSLTIAGRLVSAFPGASAIVATGSPCATQFETPGGVEIVKLPSIGKAPDGHYQPRALASTLDEVLAIRRSLLTSLWTQFRPDLFVVDHQVTGMLDEVLHLLERARGDDVRTLLGIRDVIDSPERVAAEWNTDAKRWALREAYDRVCVYGCPTVFDSRTQYPFPPELGRRLEFAGYVVRPGARPMPQPIPELQGEVLFTAGGGEDGEHRVNAYLSALELAPAEWRSTLVLGPMLNREAERRVRLRARRLDGVDVHRFRTDLPQLMSRAHAIVSMAGYNTVAEILAMRRPSVLLPRRHPRHEQELRAESLERLGIATCAHENDVRGLRASVEQALSSPRVVASTQPRMDGVEHVARVAAELLDREPAALACEVR